MHGGHDFLSPVKGLLAYKTRTARGSDRRASPGGTHASQKGGINHGTGVLRSCETAPPWDRIEGLCLEPYGGPMGCCFL